MALICPPHSVAPKPFYSSVHVCTIDIGIRVSALYVFNLHRRNPRIHVCPSGGTLHAHRSCLVSLEGREAHLRTD